MLNMSDWTQLLDAPLTKQEQDEWKIYRQDLRDLPQTQLGVEPERVVFPTDPEGKVFDIEKGERIIPAEPIKVAL